MRGDDCQPSPRLLHDLCALLLASLSSPPSSAASSPLPKAPRITLAGLASLLLGASLSLMLCGSVTFMLGFFLMPWIVGLVAIAYVVGFVSNLSGFARPNPPSVSKNMPGSFLPII